MHDIIIYIILLATGVEENNDCARRSYFFSNHFDASKEVLVSEAKKEILSNKKRVKRSYKKDNTEYWHQTIFTKRRRATEVEERSPPF